MIGWQDPHGSAAPHSSESRRKLVPSDVNARWSERTLMPAACDRRSIETGGSPAMDFRTRRAEWL